MSTKPFILPKDIPLDQYPKPEAFLAEGKRIVEAAQQAGITMRVMGPLALHYYFPEQIDLYAKLERLGDRYFTDIDYAAYGKTSGKMPKFMETLGYECDLQTMHDSGKTRHIYFAGPVPMIDVFFDKLDYCHEVNYDRPPRARPLQRVAGRHHAAEAADLGDQRQGPEGHRVPAHDGRRSATTTRRRSTSRSSPSASATTGASGTRPRPTSAASRSTSTRSRRSATSRSSTSRIAATSCWRASRPSPRPRRGTSAPRRAPSKLWYNTGFSDW